MNLAAAHSAKLIADFERQQQGETSEVAYEYPSKHPFGGAGSGPFGGASADLDPSTSNFVNSSYGLGMVAPNGDESQFTDWDVSYMGGATSAATAADPSRHPAGPVMLTRPLLTQFDYPAGWGAQTQVGGVGGLTQDSASRIATLQAKLNQRLGPEYLSQRPGPGGSKKLTYIEGWKLVDLANEVFGFNGWSTSIIRLDVDYLDCSPDGTRFNAGVSCVVRVTLRDGTFHEDIGYGSADNAKQKHAALEKGKKEAVTDATKRALKNFGKLLGNCTYDHQYSMQALKVSNPVVKFDPTELHRRPELRAAMQQHQQQQQQNQQPLQQTSTTLPAAHGQIARPIQQGSKPVTATSSVQVEAQAAHRVEARGAATGNNSASPTSTTQNGAMGPPAPMVKSAPSTLGQVSAKQASSSEALVKPSLSEGTASEADAAFLRQQRSLMARRAYLERQQAEVRKASSLSAAAAADNVNGRAGANSSSRREQDGTDPQEADLGSDSFDETFGDDLVNYDDTDMADAEVASMALEMEINVAAGDDRNDDAYDAGEDDTADDSGVAFPSSNFAKVKHEKIGFPDARPNATPDQRRSLSPVKQVKAEHIKPRRAGSVGRFVSPPPATNGGCTTVAPMKNGSTSLSACSSSRGAATAKAPNKPDFSAIRQSRSNANTHAAIAAADGSTNAAISNNVGVEGSLKRQAGKATGQPVNHSYMPATTATSGSRGVKRPHESPVIVTSASAGVGTMLNEGPAAVVPRQG